MSSIQKILWAVLLFVFLSTTGTAQKRFSISNYTTKNGLPENNLQSIQLDESGFLWASHSTGLLRFDGYNFRNYPTTSVPYSSFMISRTLNNELLAWEVSGTVFEIRDQKIETLRTGAVNSINYFTAKGILPSKEFYFEYTTPHFNNKRDLEWQYPPLLLFPISKEDAVIRTKTGLSFYHYSNKIKSINLSAYSPKQFLSINKKVYFFSSKNELFWVNTSTWTVEPCFLSGDLNQNQLFKNQPQLLSNSFWDYTSSASCILFENSLYEFTSTSTNPRNVRSNLITTEIPQNCIVTSLIYRPQNNLLLIATDSKGLFVFREQTFKFLTYPNPERGTNNSYYFQLEMDSHTVYTDWGREFTSKGGVKSKLKLDRNYSENILRDKNNCLWFMQGERVLCRYNPKTNKTNTIHNPKNELALCYFEEGDSIWVGCTQSIGYIKNDTLKIVKELENNNSNSNIFQITRWKENKLWLCNYTGVFKYDSKSQKLDTVHALFQTYPYNFTIYKDYLIVGTFGRGFYFYKDGITRKMPQDANHYLQQPYLFVNDSLGYIWIATSNGIYKTRFEDLEKYFKDTTYKVSYIHYGEEDGILSPEFNGGCVPAYITLKNGFTSLPNVEGLVWFKPNEIKNPDLSSPFFWDGIYADDSLLLNSNLTSIPSTIHTLRIDFSTPYWATADNLHLEYKLEGYSNQWLPIKTTQNSVSFSNLPSGKYTFLLRKRSGFNPNDYIRISIAFEIDKKFYETAWFFMFCLLLAFVFTFAVARMYAVNIKKRNKALELSVQERTTELSEANEELKQSVAVKDKLISIIAHDIVTPLNFITVVAQKSSDKSNNLDNDNMRSVLVDIKNTTQKLRDNAQNILSWIKHQNKRITISKTNVAISALVDDISEQFIEITASKNTKIVNNISEEDIIKTDATIVSIILHNLLSNACKFTEGGRIEITAIQTESSYSFIIKDTGKGMSKEQKLNVTRILNKESISTSLPISGENGNGLGYIIIVELLELLLGSLHVESEPGQGTTVRLTLQL